MAQREVFANAPLVLVAAEFRFPYSPRVVRQDGFEALASQLTDVVPIAEREDARTIAIGPSTAQVGDGDVRHRLLDRTRTSAVTFAATRVLVETTDYSEYPAFRLLAGRALSALADLRVVPGLERIGLRYVDEIRVPDEVQSLRDWDGWINPALLAPLSLVGDDYDPTRLEGRVRLRVANGRHLSVRFAGLTGQGVVGGGPLRRPKPPTEGPFFVVDTDSYWEPTGPLDEFEPGAALAILDLLHDPAGELFQRAVTERLRREVLRGEEIG